jgi:hypothetical protein
MGGLPSHHANQHPQTASVYHLEYVQSITQEKMDKLISKPRKQTKECLSV